VKLSDWKRTLLRGTYTRLAWAMWLVPFVVYYWLSGGEKDTPALYWAEFAGAVIFSCYWWCKTVELDALGTQEMRLSGTGLPSFPKRLSGTGLPVFPKEPPGMLAKVPVIGRANDTIDAARHIVGRMFD
jgi:hypothetical protein